MSKNKDLNKGSTRVEQTSQQNAKNAPFCNSAFCASLQAKNHFLPIERLRKSHLQTKSDWQGHHHNLDKPSQILRSSNNS